jgi:lipopolysaccharide transport system permease protein
MTSAILDAPRPYLKIRPSSGWRALDLAQVWQYRDLLLTLAKRDIKLRYRQTFLGVLWVVFQPLMAAGIFSFVFGKVASLPSDGIPYFMFSFAGLLGWNLFSNTVGKAGGSLLGNAHLISKVFFPRIILPLSSVVSTLIDFAVALAMLAVLMAIYHVAPSSSLLLLPVWLTLLLMLGLGAGLLTSAMGVTYRDIGYIVPVLTQFLLYASPVAYATSAVPPRLRVYYFLNPLSGLLDAFRWSLLGRGEIQWGCVAYSMVFCVALFALGALMFKRMERKFADVI